MEISIAYVNDVHGYLLPHPELFYTGGREFTATAGGYARIASVIRELKKPGSHHLCFDGGDTFHGTLPLVESRGEVLVPILNAIGFDAMVGHWDFAYGPQQLKNLEAQLVYPVLGINVYQLDGSPFLTPWIIKTFGGVRVGITGICCNIIDKTMPAHFSEGLRITDGREELPGVIKTLREEGADIIILLSHNGFPQDVSLLEAVSGVDVCLSAHTHNRLYEAVEVNGTVVIQCGCHGSFVGQLCLQLDNKKLAGYTYRLITVDDQVEPDEAVAGMVSAIMGRYPRLEESAGETRTLLHRYDTLHSTMDDLLLDAISEAAGTTMAFSNGWRYGAPIPPGIITRQDLYNIIPMNPVVSTVELTGEEIRQMLEQNLERTFSADPMKQMGGYVKRARGIWVNMRIENPNGRRIQQIFSDDGELLPGARYKVAFVTSQGVPDKLGINREDLPVKAVEAMERYLRVHQGYTGRSTGAYRLV